MRFAWQWVRDVVRWGWRRLLRRASVAQRQALSHATGRYTATGTLAPGVAFRVDAPAPAPAPAVPLPGGGELDLNPILRASRDRLLAGEPLAPIAAVVAAHGTVVTALLTEADPSPNAQAYLVTLASDSAVSGQTSASSRRIARLCTNQRRE